VLAPTKLPSHRGEGVSCPVEAIIPAGPRRHRVAADDPEADRGNCRTDESRTRPVQQFGADHEDKARLQCEDQCCASDHQEPGCGQTAFPGQRICESPTRHQDGCSGEAAYRQSDADVPLGPAQMGEVERDERAEAHLHVGRKEIHPVQAVPAARRSGPLQLALGAAMVRDGRAGASKSSADPGNDRHRAATSVVP
jgi:hypothetical protein